MHKRSFLILFYVFFLSCSQPKEKHYCFFIDDYNLSEYSEKGGTPVSLNKSWQFSDFSKINEGQSVLYKSEKNKKNITIAINAGHGTVGGSYYKTFSHPDKTPKLTGGTTETGAIESIAVSQGMKFCYGMDEAEMNLRLATVIRKKLLENGFDVLMIRNSSDVQLDNVARTVIANNIADIHIALHFDSDGLSYDKGIFYCGMPPQLQYMSHIADNYKESERLGISIVNTLKKDGNILFNNGRVEIDLTTTSYATIPTVVIELGNQHTILTIEKLENIANSLCTGVESFLQIH